jgi:inward rectifier potassium channel
MMTGIIFARFARPTAKVLFADKAVIGPRNGVPHLMFRMANWRRNQIVEAQLNAMLLVTEVTTEGESMRRPERLTLVRSSNPMFALTWTAMHRIDEDSPFYAPDALDKLRAQRAEIFLSLTGMDETMMQTIHARFRYQLSDIEQDARFVDIVTLGDDGVRTIDFERFHDTVPIRRS